MRILSASAGIWTSRWKAADIKRIHIRRVHLEEDTGKLTHAGGNESEVDYNRSGVPLMEIVTEFPPDISSAEEARAYLEKLRSISGLSRRFRRQNGGRASAGRAEPEHPACRQGRSRRQNRESRT